MVVARNIQNKNTTATIGTITLGLNNMFVFETSVEHQLELTLGASVQFKPLQGQIRFLSDFNSIDIRFI
jgi:hypothetical protein